ncbi:alanine racemase [Gulosibacter chungangensis]|uniref:alanine racemase n=1 Tax=Gulosibacter chungangensis TaxID=979746 RepID=UPI00178861B9|nr:alanine racemase [Gulosibacter chungangensis]
MKPLIEVDLDAIRENYRTFRDTLGVAVIPVVKAEAYGHGALAVAQAVVGAGAPMIGVADAREAIALRDAGIEVPILAWLHSPMQDWDATFAADLELGISSFDMLARVGERARNRVSSQKTGPLRIHLKLDTGLGRNGAREVDWLALFAQARDLERTGQLKVVGIMSHISGASETDDLAQIARFERGLTLAEQVGLQPELVHLCATGAALKYPQARYDAVRIGIGIYGLSPFDAGEDPGIPLRPALSLRAPLAHGFTSEEEHSHSWRIDIGSADGLPPLEIAGLEALPPLVDNFGDRWQIELIEENHSIVEPYGDLTEPSPDGRGDRRILTAIGPQTTADDWAAAAETINYEITTRLSGRIDRAYLAPERLRAADTMAAGSDRRVAPLRKAVIDLDKLRVGLQEQYAPVDLSADAYGHGAAELLPLVLEEGLEVVARTYADVARLRELGAKHVQLYANAPEATRTFYGLSGDTRHAALALRSELIHVKRVAPGQAVSYGYRWRAAEHTTLGLVPIGYADAIPRVAFERAYVSVGGATAPIVGRVAMDQVVIDLGDNDCWPGMPVHIWGSATGDVSLHDWASWTDLTPAALCATLGQRVNRVYVTREPYESAGFGLPAVRVISSDGMMSSDQGDSA